MQSKLLVKVAVSFLAMVLLCLCEQNTVVRADETEYLGIQIDGDFSDWNAVSKTEVDEEGLNEVAFVFDGDYLYFYINAQRNWTASSAGPYSNGKYAITTDLGNVMLFQLVNADKAPAIKGVDDAQIAYSNLRYGYDSYYYEISIPASELPNYVRCLSFGLYTMDPYVKDVANLQGTDSGADEFTGIVYDGFFDDWSYYPHSVIQYATGGTHENVVDGHAALYSDSFNLYGHVTTSYSRHLNSSGGVFTSNITIGINSLPSEFYDDYNEDEWLNYWPWNWLGQWDWLWNRLNTYFLDRRDFYPELCFYPQFVTIDEDGRINYNPKKQKLDRGTYEFYLIDQSGWKSARYAYEWEDESSIQYGKNAIYGRATVEIGASTDQMEFEIYIDALANKFDLEINDVQVFCARFGEIGSQWVTCAGTSTGTWIGIALCVLVVVFVLLGRKLLNKGVKRLPITECEPAMQK